MSAPIIFSGSNAKLLNSAGILNKAGTLALWIKTFISGANDSTGWVSSNPSNVTVSTSTSTSRGANVTQTTSVVITRISGTTDYARYRFTLDAVNYNWLCSILWDQSYAGTSGDYQLQLWSNTASNYGGSYTQIILPTTNIPSGTLPFNTTALTPGSGNQYLELRIVAVSGTTPLYLNNVTFTPGAPSQGAAVSDWQSYTPTLNSTSGMSTYGAYWRRVGSNMEIRYGHLRTSAGPSAQDTFTIPSGYTINTSIIPNYSGSIVSVGIGKWFKGGTADYVVEPVITNTTTIGLVYNDGTNNLTNLQSSNETGGNSNVYAIVTIPIAEWAGNGTVNLGPGAQVEYAATSGTWDAASSTTVYGPGGAAVGGALTASRTKSITFQYPIQPSDQIVIEGSNDQVGWFQMNNGLLNSVPVIPTMDSGGSFVSGVTWTKTGASTIDVTFRTYANVANDDAPATNWPSSCYWRVRKATASAPVGFGLATSTTAGLYSPTTAFSNTAMPAFRVDKNGSSQSYTGSGSIQQVTWSTANANSFNQGSGFSSNSFTVPAGQSGVYTFSVSVSAAVINVNSSIAVLRKNGTNIARGTQFNANSSTRDLTSVISVQLSLVAGDVIDVVYAAANNQTINGNTDDSWFSGARLY